MIRLGIPSKGRLMGQTFDWFSERGINLVRSESDREYAGHIEGIKTFSLFFYRLVRSRENFLLVDCILELLELTLFKKNWLGLIAWLTRFRARFWICRFDYCGPSFWVDVETLDDLDAVSAQFRYKHGYRLRIATKYHRLLREFLMKAGVADYQIVDSQGATEGAVKNGLAEAIADITSTGNTLKANHLKILSDGLILKSQATLFKSSRQSFLKRKARLLIY